MPFWIRCYTGGRQCDLSMDSVNIAEVFSAIASRSADEAPMPAHVDAVHNQKKHWTNVLHEALGGFAGIRSLTYREESRLDRSALKQFSEKELVLSKSIRDKFDKPRTPGRRRPKNQHTSAKFLKYTREFVEHRRCYDGVVERAAAPVIVSEVEWLLGYDELILDFVKLLYVKSALRLFVHRCPDRRRPVLPCLQEFMSCFAGHVKGETYLVILAMDFDPPGSTIGHYFTVPRSGKLSIDEIAFHPVAGSPYPWLSR